MEKYLNFSECIGYLASLLVLTSFLMKHIKHIRLINLCGCIAFITYGFFIDSWPVIISNIAIAVVQLYYLNALRKEKA